MYFIDVKKIKDIEDVKLIIELLNTTLNIGINDAGDVERFKHLLQDPDQLQYYRVVFKVFKQNRIDTVNLNIDKEVGTYLDAIKYSLTNLVATDCRVLPMHHDIIRAAEGVNEINEALHGNGYNFLVAGQMYIAPDENNVPPNVCGS